MKQAGLWLAIAVAATAFGIGFGTGTIDAGTALLVLVLAIPVTVVAVQAAGDTDRQWLPWVILAGWATKLVGSTVRYLVLVDLYEGSGDAVGYHNRGLVYADTWRSLQIPDLTVGSAGTTFVSKATALLYAPHEPSLLGGFYLFATIAFFGQVLLYLAYRRALPDRRLGWYAAAVFFLPSLLFWPSSIGKDSLMLFFIGIVAYGTARLLSQYRIRWVLLIGAGLLGTASIRSHIAALFGVAVAAAVLLGRAPEVRAARTRRLVLMTAAAAGVAVLLTFASASLGVDLSGDDLDPFLADLERRTQQGGSAVEGEAVLSLTALPAGALRVLYRPLINEVVNVQTLVSAAEGTALLVLTLWRLPRIAIEVRQIRRNPYLAFSLTAVAGFVVGFSAVFNLGILARQRIQALPLLLVVIVAMGWKEKTPPTSEAAPAPRLAPIP